MRLNIAETVKEKEIYLKFFQETTGNITVYCTDKNDQRIECSNLITFKQDGTIFLHGGVTPNLGFKMDGDNVALLYG